MSTSPNDESKYERLRREYMESNEFKAKMREYQRWTWAANVLLVFAYVVAMLLYLILLPLLVFRLLPCLYAKNIRAMSEGVVVYSLLGGEHSRHAWAEIEAFWILPINGSAFPPIEQWQLVLKDRRTIPLPLARGKAIWSICQARNIPTNCSCWSEAELSATEKERPRRYPGGRYLI